MSESLSTYGGDARIVVTRAEITRVASQLAAVEHLLARVALELPAKVALAPTPEHLVLLAQVPRWLVRLRYLQFCCWVSSQSYFTTEGKVRNLMQTLMPGVTSAVAHLAVGGMQPTAATNFKARVVTDAVITSPPNSIRTLLNRLQTTANFGDGTIRIESWFEGGRRHFIVYLPGTQDWSVDGSSNPLNLPSDIQAFSGEQADAHTALLLALKKAGAQPGDEVMLVAHSQGGLVAANLAKHPSGFDISAIVSFAAPMVGVGVLGKTLVMAVEHTGDPIPYLAGKANPVAKNWVTIQSQSSKVGMAAHDLPTYAPTASAIDRSKKKSVTSARQKLLARIRTRKVKVQLIKVRKFG